ncbi:MAG TPA: LytTR family DNA-binding domain-containing protein [Lentimicrobium sp.]|nr:LytTR family DNA-binding domain-containing protein [Lentimicrobium sp.]
MKLRSLIIEDEPPAQEVLKLYAGDCPAIELVAVCRDAFAASEVLLKEKIDLLFLDINLPRLSGINFLKTLQYPPMVIFTTAYPEYAIEGFEHDAVDYLVKPFSFDRFLKAVNKAMEKSVIRNKEQISAEVHENFIVVRSDKKTYRINCSDILFIESTGDYLKIQLAGKHLVIHETLTGIMEQLPSNDFIRVHKSFIAALSKVAYIDGNQMRIADFFIPIGRIYKENLEKSFGNRRT